MPHGHINLGTSKIKNKTARKILQSDAATNLLNND